MTMTNYTFTFNGLTIGTGTSYLVSNVEGLGGTAPLRVQDDNRGYLDGSYSGRDFYDERTVYIDITVLGSGSTTAQANYKALQTAFAPQPLAYYTDPTGYTPAANQVQPFTFRLNGNTGDMVMYGRSRGLNTPLDAEFAYGYIKTRIMMTFPDPRYYTYTGESDTGTSVSVWNEGWAISCPTISLVTAATSGSITDGTTTMNFANMSTGAALDIDLLSRVIYLDGEPTRNIMTAASSGWLQVNPNVLNTSPVTWTSTIGSMTVVFRNAYV